MKKYYQILISLSVVLFLNNSCTYQYADQPLPETNYPDDIEVLLFNNCATAGCHNKESKHSAGGLELTTWDKLFEGGRGGSVVIPYRPDFSTLCYYINTDTLQGLVLQPTMPYNKPPLTSSEYSTIKNWILDGAPDKNGFVKFSHYQNRSKLYICNRGCDVITVMDPATGLAMRYVDVGNITDIEGPCMVKVSPDKLHWYVLFNQGTTIEKYRTSDNGKVGEINIGTGFWSSVVITADSRNAFISDANITGRILYADLENLQIVTTYQSGLRYPFGLCLNNSNNRLYATSQEGNYIYKINISDALNPIVEEISLETNVPVTTNPTLNPYHILLSKDESNYFVTCNKTSELRIMQSSNDSLLSVFSTGSNPAEMIVSTLYPYLFISCMGVPGTNKKSIINIFNYSTGAFLPEVYAGHDSKGIILDESGNKLIVANRNVSEGGPDAHHAPLCEGKNGYITAIDLNTLQLISGFKAELSVDPYQIGQ